MHEIGGRQTVFTRKHFSLHEDLQKVIAFLYYFIRFVFYFKYFESKSRLEKKKNIRDNVFIRPCFKCKLQHRVLIMTGQRIKLS